MLKRHNINSNSPREKLYSASGKTYSRKISCFSLAGVCCKLSGACLLLLAFLLINPTITSVSALETEEAPDGANHDDQTMPTAHTSDISISFSPTSGSASLTPTNSAGQSAQINVLATVGVKNSGGYSVYVKGSSQNLVGQKSSSNVIPGVSGSSTYANLPVNTWGYYAGTGTTIPENATYKAVTTSGNGDKVAENTNTRIDSDTKTIALSFAAKVNDQKPADTYKNTITLSVVSSPKQVTFTDFTTTMQGMTSSICSQVSDGAEAQLKDTRDGKYYWVGKLADGKCWMTQNLDLDLFSDAGLVDASSDLNSKTFWNPEHSTVNSADSSTILADNAGQRSWSLGDYRITNPTISSSCGSGKNSAANCPSQFTAYATPTTANGDANAHYILGNHYQWNAATAGSGAWITDGQAQDSICPKGWRLPESNTTTPGSFTGLIIAGNIDSNVSKLTSAPYYFTRSGYINQNASSLFDLAGSGGYYWSSTPNSNSYSTYYLAFDGDSSLYTSASNYRQGGFSIRCIAR